MLAGFLFVLKIIGIILLVILAVVLLLVILVLFVPIFYKVDALVPETDLDEVFDVNKIRASASFSWLLFVIRGGISFPDEKEFTLKVCGFQILPQKSDGSEDKEDKETEHGVIEMSDMGEFDDNKEDSGIKQEDEANISSDESKTDEKAVATENEDASEETSGDASWSEEYSSTEDENYETEDGEYKSFIDVLWKIIDTIQNILETPINVLEKIQYTISRVCGKIDMVKTTLESDIFKRAFELVKKKLIKIILMILPDKSDIDVYFGSGNPALTAEIMGAYGAIYPFVCEMVRFTPDFERRVVYADIHFKGHITVFTIVYSAAVCYFNRDVRRTIRRFKKIISN